MLLLPPARPGRSRRLRALGACACVLVLSCSSSDGGGGAADRAASGETDAEARRPPVALPDDVRAALARPDEVHANVTWKPATRVIEEARLRAILESPFSDDGVYFFDDGAAEIQALTPGDVAVLSSVGIFRVSSVTAEGGRLRLATEPAALDEAAEEVDIRWDVAVPKSSAWVDYQPDSPSEVDDPGTLARAGGLGGRDFRGVLEGFETTFGVRPSPGDVDTYDFGLSAKQLQGDTTGALSAIGWAARFRTQGEIVVQAGTFRSAKIAVTDAIAEATVKMGMTKLSKKASFDLPPLLVIPFTYAGLPLFISVGAAIDFEATGHNQSAILGTAKLGVRGDAAFLLSPGEGSQFAADLKELKTEWIGGEHTATVKVGLGAVVHFPKLSFGIGLPQMQDRVSPEVRKLLDEQWKSVGLGSVAKLPHAVSASAYVKLATELVYNVSVEYDGSGGVPTVRGTCAEISLNGGIFYGGELRLFGHHLSKEIGLPDKLFDKQAAGRVGAPVTFGTTCK
jgi:hypothetical protein